MEKLIARVRNGRLVLDAPTDLPEGADVPLEISDDWDTLDDAERARLHAALEHAIAQADRGELIPADELLRRLRSARR